MVTGTRACTVFYLLDFWNEVLMTWECMRVEYAYTWNDGAPGLYHSCILSLITHSWLDTFGCIFLFGFNDTYHRCLEL